MHALTLHAVGDVCVCVCVCVCKVFHLIYIGNISVSAGKQSVWENTLLHVDNF